MTRGLSRLSTLPEITATPEGVSRRASVALIIRFVNLDGQILRPKLDRNYETLEDYLLEHDTSDYRPEVLFIERVTRTTDRWSGHVALPGGKRDPEDVSDLAVCIRETQEEVGLDISVDPFAPGGTISEKAIYVGSLTQRPVLSRWGKKNLMTLCPYVFILRDPNTKITCQETEIAATLWVPVYQLKKEITKSGSSASWITSNYASRMKLAYKGRFFTNWIADFLGSKFGVGELLFPAANISSESVSIPAIYSDDTLVSKPAKKSVLLWGLTHGMIIDFLEIIQPGSILPFIRWPTFSYLDVRFWIRLLSWFHVRRVKNQFRRISRNYNSSNMDLMGLSLNNYFNYVSGGIYLSMGFRAVIIILGLYRLKLYFRKP
ncbi:hypothetical protein NADFUDRAFT_69357 [Nadsonia fulvescens var. elongata DSM 6958]|uniref:Nudix hydrolase domain-containing protein n=1 Tax=Nadsonia fulvescens var. elongata DSM 6958 TaxID=857566 RepID=A0A1E3PQJ7_9ASCO|nr:hypothetical protein NADFUDRAFT_69357 [Nadsonia fulvescens var. elongata DSM 6958]